MIFSLPFHLTRYFRPTILEAFAITNSELGDAFAIYGLTAMISYFPGGILADKFSIRHLMSGSLIATSVGGIYLLYIPNSFELSLLYGYWGITSILFFWAALIKATRQWGGVFSQGKAFGYLDGGRGLVAATFATLSVFIFSSFLPNQEEFVENVDRIYALQIVITYYILITAITALVVWFVLPKNDEDNHHGKTKNMFITPKLKLIFDKNIFFIAITVVCAYCGYKGLDNITLYLVQTLNWHEASAASFAAYATYLRPISAISAGVIADKFDCSKTIKNLFLISILVYLILFSTTPNNHTAWIIYLNILLTFVTVFALRGIYFALLQDAQFPQSKTGVIVGFVSLIGYTPDIFFGSLTGRILDNSPGVAGHQNYFLFLMVISILGLITTYFLSRNKTVKYK
tara:strand:- start:36 stop:1241 length:1206 start_codon:yes stop_codon:yes gene_type:complete